MAIPSTKELTCQWPNYSNLAWSQILFYVHQQTTVPDQGINYEENPSSYHGGMCEDGQTNILGPFI